MPPLALPRQRAPPVRHSVQATGSGTNITFARPRRSRSIQRIRTTTSMSSPTVLCSYVRAPGALDLDRGVDRRALDRLAALDGRAGGSRAITFTNWLTADQLRNPQEPLPSEDLVSVDANHLRATDARPGGYFASYHAYPYHPRLPPLRRARSRR